MGLKPALAPCGRGFTGVLYFSMIIAKTTDFLGMPHANRAKRGNINNENKPHTYLIPIIGIWTGFI